MVKIIDLNEDNFSEIGLACYTRRKDREGYQRSVRWLKERFAEGMKIKIIRDEGRGLIEYIPGEYAWRAAHAEGYMFIHCLWVVGKSKGKGYATALLNECIKDAKKSGMLGVAVVTSERPWLVGESIFLKNGFDTVDEAPPSFKLLVKKFDDAHSPSFVHDWERKMKRCGRGLTIFTSDQCPHFDFSVKWLIEAGEDLGIKTQVVKLKSPEDVRKLSPTAYGVFGVIFDGKLVSYHYIFKVELLKYLKKLKEGAEFG